MSTRTPAQVYSFIVLHHVGCIVRRGSLGWGPKWNERMLFDYFLPVFQGSPELKMHLASISCRILLIWNVQEINWSDFKQTRFCWLCKNPNPRLCHSQVWTSQAASSFRTLAKDFFLAVYPLCGAKCQAGNWGNKSLWFLIFGISPVASDKEMTESLSYKHEP